MFRKSIAFLGKALSAEEILRILTRLGFEFSRRTRTMATNSPSVPSWRLDVEREIDLIEEIARLHGYDRFPNTLPAFSGAVIELPDAAKNAKLRTSLLGLGYNEAVSLTFISSEDASRFSPATALSLANPLSEEASVMRTSLVPGMLNMLAYNLNRGGNNVRLFEAGHVYETDGTKSLEPKQICLGATGRALPTNVNRPNEARELSFFDLKGDIETILDAFQSTALHYDAQASDYYHPRPLRARCDGRHRSSPIRPTAP